jgi:hypothetical protein
MNGPLLRPFMVIALVSCAALLSACATTPDSVAFDTSPTETPSESPTRPATELPSPASHAPTEDTGSPSPDDVPPLPRDLPASCVGDLDMQETYGVEFHDVEDWADHADAVAVVSVTDESPGPKFTELLPNEGAQIARNVTLTVESVYIGPLEQGQHFLVRGHEPYVISPDGALAENCSVLRLGGRALVALIGDGTSPDDSALLTADSALLLDRDNRIIPTGRIGATQALEKMELQEVVDLVLSARAESEGSEPTNQP